MPIVHFRVDQRMIHGQVAIAWSKAVNPNHIILANDSVANNSLQQSLMRVAVPKSVRLSMVSVDKTIGYLKRGLQPNENVFLLTSNIHDARTIFESVLLGKYDHLNIGNMTLKEKSIKLTDRIFATPEEIQDAKWFINNKIYIYFQMLPTDQKISFAEILEENNL